jgi:hypothetical protein
VFAAIDRASGGMISTEIRYALPAEMRSLTGDMGTGGIRRDTGSGI